MKLLIALLLLFTLPAAEALARTPRKKLHTVQFVCTGNFYRSRFAQAIFNDHPAPAWVASQSWAVADVPRLAAPDAFQAIARETDALIAKLATP